MRPVIGQRPHATATGRKQPGRAQRPVIFEYPDRVQKVIYDLGGVLFRWNPAEIVRGFYADEASRSVAAREIFAHPDWLELDRGTLAEEAAVRGIAARIGRPEAELRALMNAVRDSLVPIDETVVLLHELANIPVPLYCLSNISVPNFEHLRQRHALFNLFQGIVVSAEVRLVKPDPLIFDHIAARFGLDPAETVFIDDSAPNIASAGARGFQTVLFRDAGQCRDELRRLLGPW